MTQVEPVQVGGNNCCVFGELLGNWLPCWGFRQRRHCSQKYMGGTRLSPMVGDVSVIIARWVELFLRTKVYHRPVDTSRPGSLGLFVDTGA